MLAAPPAGDQSILPDPATSRMRISMLLLLHATTVHPFTQSVHGVQLLYATLCNPLYISLVIATQGLVPYVPSKHPMGTSHCFFSYISHSHI